MELVFGIVLLVLAVFLIVAVLMQDGQSKDLSGAITGNSDTFFGKNGAATTKQKVLSTVTTVVAIIFAVAVLAMYIIVG